MVVVPPLVLFFVMVSVLARRGPSFRKPPFVPFVAGIFILQVCARPHLFRC